jgi:hypothetical protein
MIALGDIPSHSCTIYGIILHITALVTHFSFFRSSSQTLATRPAARVKHTRNDLCTLPLTLTLPTYLHTPYPPSPPSRSPLLAPPCPAPLAVQLPSVSSLFQLSLASLLMRSSASHRRCIAYDGSRSGHARSMCSGGQGQGSRAHTAPHAIPV